MNTAAFLLLCTIAIQQSEGLDNLDFASGKMTGWEGEGFYITTASGTGPGLRFGVCSSDNGMPGRTGTLKRTITAPTEGGILRCTAFAKRNDEIGDLGRNFNRMVIQLRESREEIELLHRPHEA